jgi:hypothetical protein
MADLQDKPYKFPDEEGNDVAFELEGEPVVEVVDDTPAADRGRKPMAEAPKDFSDEELESYNESVKKRIQHFTKGYHEERRAKEAASREREEALRLAQTVIEENQKLKGSLNQGHTALLEQAKKVVDNEVAMAEAKMRIAYESGDSSAIAEAQRELTTTVLKADKIANFKAPSLQEGQSQVQTPQRQPEPQRLYHKTEDWRSRNPWFGQNRRMTSYALALHEELTQDERIDPTSDEYYQRIDAEMKSRFPDAFESERQVDATPSPKKSNVAPATRSTATKKIVLTQSQVNIAKRLGIPLEVYAKEVAKQNRRVE